MPHELIRTPLVPHVLAATSHGSSNAKLQPLHSLHTLSELHSAHSILEALTGPPPLPSAETQSVQVAQATMLDVHIPPVPPRERPTVRLPRIKVHPTAQHSTAPRGHALHLAATELRPHNRFRPRVYHQNWVVGIVAEGAEVMGLLHRKLPITDLLAVPTNEHRARELRPRQCRPVIRVQLLQHG